MIPLKRRCDMTAEPLRDATYKITLDKTEAAEMPSNGNPREMSRFIRSILDRLAAEPGVILPEGRLLVEVFLRSDESLVLFISPLDAEQDKGDLRYFACDVTGIDNLRALCGALSLTNEKCSIYCSDKHDSYRLVFTGSDNTTRRICTEYGDYCEISPLFAAQTEEYLIAIAHNNGAQFLSKILD